MYYVDIIVSFDATLKACGLASFQVPARFHRMKKAFFFLHGRWFLSTINASVFILGVGADVSEASAFFLLKMADWM